jgi:hypothetical protein
VASTSRTETGPTALVDGEGVVNGSAPGRSTRWRAQITGQGIGLAAVLGLALAFYMWTAASTFPFSFPTSSPDFYNQLTTAFLHGHTYLPLTPPAGLLRLANPYDPALNAPYAAPYHDLVLYHGRFYSQWGPTPVVTLFAPFRITGRVMSESFAVALYAWTGLVCSVLLLRALLTHLVPGTPRWVLPVAAAGLALTNVLPFLLRRPLWYEVAIASGYCFEMAGLWLMVTSVLGPELRRWRMIGGSLCLGLAIGGRPTLAIGGAVAVAAALWEHKRRTGTYGLRWDAESRKLLTYALGPFVLCGLLLALYNYQRFGGFTNFGERYELAGIDQTEAPFYKFPWLGPGLFTYLLLPVRVALTFPHFFLQTAGNDPFSLPRGYAGGAIAEPTGGVFTTMPITLLLFALPFMWWKRRGGERRPLVAATGLAILGLTIVTLVSWALFGTTERYEVDFVSLLLIPAFLVWAMLLVRARPRTTGRRLAATVGIILTLAGATVGAGISVTGYYDYLKIEHPSTFSVLEDVTAPVATIATMIGGSPQIARIDDGPLPVTPGGPSESTFGLSQDHASAWLGSAPMTLTVLSPGSRRTAVFVTVSPGPGAPPLRTVAIKVSSGGRSTIIPLIGRRARLPVSLHWGLNRIHVTVAGTATSAQEVLLTDISFSY